MDVQSEKLHLIEQLLRVQDADIIQKMKDVLNDSAIGYDAEGHSIAQAELVSRAEDSNKAIAEGDTKTIDQIRANMKNW